jgi:acyl-CoA thioesterase YciA
MTDSQADSPTRSTEPYLALKAAMMPRDTNVHGTIFGGVLLSYIDQAGAVGARFEARQNGWPDRALVTVGMERVEFHQPVHVGDVVSFWTRLVRVGRTSITIHVLVDADQGGQTVKLTEAIVTYVAVELRDGQRERVSIRGE